MQSYEFSLKNDTEPVSVSCNRASPKVLQEGIPYTTENLVAFIVVSLVWKLYGHRLVIPLIITFQAMTVVGNVRYFRTHLWSAETAEWSNYDNSNFYLLSLWKKILNIIDLALSKSQTFHSLKYRPDNARTILPRVRGNRPIRM